MTATDDHLDDLVGKLGLEDKVRLLTGRDFWTTWPIEEIGLRRMIVSDGPSGVRGEVWDERSPSLNLPSATSLSSTWDTSIAARYGAIAAVEARRKGVDVVLGPTINLHRSPLGGRHFEAFSEDPLLTARLAASYVRGLQDNGVGATPKHYVANDFETDRFTVDVRLSERALREVYLRAFEDAVVQERAWLVMSAYNSINGATATENELLETPLNSEWGFDGVVISDWTAVRSLRSAEHSQDLVMPGPEGPWGEALVEAVRGGVIVEAVVDRKVRRILRLAARVGALEGFEPVRPVRSEDGVAFAREAAAEGSVLLANDGVLPLSDPARIAVIGHNALHARTQGGGSATVLPERVVSPLEGVRAAFPGAEVSYSLGAIVQEGLAELDRDAMRNPVTGEPGARVEMLDAEGALLFTEDRLASGLVYFGGDAPIGELATLVFETDYTPTNPGPQRIGFASVGTGRVLVDGELLAEHTTEAVGTDLGAAFLSPPAVSAPVHFRSGRSVRLRVEFSPQRMGGGLSNALSITIGTEPADVDADELIAEASRAAAEADAAVVVVGTNSRVESEGYDRTDLSLPGRQDDLVRAVLTANPRTIVLVNAGAPVLLPWREHAAAIVLNYFAGQAYGSAVGDILTGAREPGGRLPTTWPAAIDDVPVLNVTPMNGALAYDEDVHIGYRAWLRAGTTPAYPFGHGLGYTTWDLTDVTTTDFTDGIATVGLTAHNTGNRAGKHVVQVYASRPDSAVDRPVRWLVGFATVRAQAGEAVKTRVPVHERDLAHWDDGWKHEPGEYTLHIGSSALDISTTTSLRAF
ncbi:beta-glucosidase family protein [Saccharopolyspora mangrovi]|uniref:Glycoside hydrolase family 3 C-terminal domain-containing protein n=1 Tax=Saccharopolyspora mangrovi TaxID=3082379 RepID=A0ABU6AES4_9PSEU|nr:glycoside hydrolase family 3 C-terminal domain-containing protein [Saccharopolyspora sp. S2-29]MEB3370047.1 glycoside hydrolase family 3 C-terminal domain-containing protein [Saccharopolyspora sp. S2-29]